MRLRNMGNRGIALVFVLLVMSVLTALVADFSYEVYVNTSLLYNWQRLQDISLVAGSGVSVASEGVSLMRDQNIPYKVVPMPPMDPFELGIDVSISVEMENAKFNLTKLVNPNGEGNNDYLVAFTRMLDALELDPILAEAFQDYMDSDMLPDAQRAEERARNAPMLSVEEMLLVAGVDREVYNILLPHVTVWGGGEININVADPPVLMALFQDITLDMARSLVEARAEKAFENQADYQRVPGFEGVIKDPRLLSTVRVNAFKVTSVAMDKDGLRREITCVLDEGGNVKYWRER